MTAAAAGAGAATERPGGRPARGLTEPRVAVLVRRGRYVVAQPAFGRGRRITLDARARAGADLGDLVLLGRGKRGVRVIRSLGRPDVARDALEALMLDRGLRRSFPRVVEQEAVEAAAAPVEGARKDLTALPTFTIDPATARDFDDAISAQAEDGDTTRIWVHIADVSAYVRPGGALERETFRRGTSVYVPGAVEPMLPEALSNQACSLVPGAPRAAVTAELELEGASVLRARFYRSTIRSDARLTYDQVDRIFAGQERAADPWGDPLAAARAVAASLAARRRERGSLAVESSEPSFEFDHGGRVIGVRHEEATESHGLIEELMILANERVAGLLADARVPTLYRVHERPEPHAIAFLVEQLASLGVPTPPVPERMSPQQAGEVAGEASRLIAGHVRRAGGRGDGLTSLLLRSLKQAYYSPRNIGHAGLASPRYCHFTSPIRRYPDLAVHRALLATLGLDDAGPGRLELEDAGVASSAAERGALDTERSAADVCSAFLLERTLSERGHESRFDGEVVGLIPAGAFVRFGDEGFEGMLPVRRMHDWWHLNEEGTALEAEASGARIRLGDPIGVTVSRVEPLRGRVDLLPAD